MRDNWMRESRIGVAKTYSYKLCSRKTQKKEIIKSEGQI